VERPQVAAGIDLKQYIGLIKQSHPALQAQYVSGTLLTMPTRNFFLNVDKPKVEAMDIVSADREGEIVDRMAWTINKSLLEKKHLVILDLLATNNWDRPVYFSSTVNSSDYLGLSEYFQLEGLAYRVVPVKVGEDEGGNVNKEVMYENMMKEFSFRNFDREDIFYDENYYRFTANARDKFATLAAAYLEDGDEARAKEIVDHCFTVLPLETVPYDYYTPQFIALYDMLGEEEKAKELLELMAQGSQKSLDYFFAKGSLFEQEIQVNMIIMQQLVGAAQQLGLNDRAAQLEQQFRLYLQRMRG
jgi:hypothetical protein